MQRDVPWSILRRFVHDCHGSPGGDGFKFFDSQKSNLLAIFVVYFAIFPPDCQSSLFWSLASLTLPLIIYYHMNDE